jgi:hypothetical protein
MNTPGFVRKLSFFLSGFILWFVHFGVLYGINGLACARGFAMEPVAGTNITVMSIVVATAIATVALIAVLFLAAAGRGPGISQETDESVRQFWRFGTIAIALLGIVAILWSGLPVLIIRPCA